MSDILYVGSTGGTSALRAAALERLGHRVTHLSPYDGLPRLWAPWLHRFGGPGLDGWVAARLSRRITRQFDLALVDNGDVIGPASVTVLREHTERLINVVCDNPFLDPLPERKRWCLYHQAMRSYDLIATVRREKVAADFARLGLKNTLQFWQAADEVAHRQPAPLEPQWASDVAFVGTWMPSRGAFLLELIERGVPISIYGDRWHKAPEFSRLARHVREGHLEPADYAKAVRGAKIALVLLNEANGDWHTKRSAEIPAIGTAMCAPRTPHHRDLYIDNVEALFFDDVTECARQCQRLLANPAFRGDVARAGHRRTFLNGTYNEPLMSAILAAAGLST
jgi:spore maturation protein CgeB